MLAITAAALVPAMQRYPSSGGKSFIGVCDACATGTTLSAGIAFSRQRLNDWLHKRERPSLERGLALLREIRRR
jgi:hypothetical protein